MRDLRENNETDHPDVTISGWVTGFDADESTLTIRDQQGLASVTTTGSDAGLIDRLDDLAVESVVELSGTLLDRDGEHFTLSEASVEVVSEPQRPLAFDPSNRPDGDFGTRLRNRHLDFRSQDAQAIFKIRDQLFAAIRSKLREWGAIEFDTPLLVPAVTDTNNTQLAVSYLDRDLRLIGHHSNQYNQLLVLGGFEKIFSIQKSFGYYEKALVHPWGVVETTMLHIESAFTDHEEFLGLTEDLIVHVYEHVAEHCQNELETLGVDLTIPEVPFRRIPYEEYLELANEIEDGGYTWGDEVDWWTQRAIMDQVGEFHFVTGMPAAHRDANERTDSDGSETVVGFDLNHPTFEIMFGSEREYRHDRLREATEAEDHLDAEEMEWFIEAFKDGVPPHAGGSLGLDRLLMGMLDLRDIREGIPFPRDREIIV